MKVLHPDADQHRAALHLLIELSLCRVGSKEMLLILGCRCPQSRLLAVCLHPAQEVSGTFVRLPDRQLRSLCILRQVVVFLPLRQLVPVLVYTERIFVFISLIVVILFWIFKVPYYICSISKVQTYSFSLFGISLKTVD